MRGATPGGDERTGLVYISIHAPHAGSDIIGKLKAAGINISIHAPHAGSDALLYHET